MASTSYSTTAFPSKLNESLYEFHRPADGDPSVELVFFHGPRLGSYTEAYLSTWMSADDSKCWLSTWLAEEIPHARILSVAYDSSATQTAEHGRNDLFVTGENLVTSVIELGEVGQKCPVVLVGHSLGGLVVKEMCLHSHRIMRLSPDTPRAAALDKFLKNVKAFFFYATPNQGSRLGSNGPLLEQVLGSSLAGPLLEFFSLLSKETSRINDDFSKLRIQYKWKASGFGESNPTRLMGKSIVVVEEASARFDVDDFLSLRDADHFSVCKPRGKTCSGFQKVVQSVHQIVREVQVKAEEIDKLQAEAAEQLPFDCTLPEHFVDDTKRVQRVVEGLQLQEPRPLCLAIVGMGGIGKTTVAKAVFIDLSRRFEYICFVNDVKVEIKRKNLEELVVDNLYSGGNKVAIERGQSVWKVLKGKRMLLVMDDVDSEQHIKYIRSRMTECPSWFGDGSRVITTSRSEFPSKFVIHRLEFLNYAESDRLFRSHLDPDVQQEIPANLITRVVQKCDGLPLTLEVIGSYLHCETNEDIWNDAVKSLSRAEALDGAEDDELWGKLNLSFRNLATREQVMFLDLVASYNDIRKTSFVRADLRGTAGFMLEVLKGAWASGGYAPDIGLKNLQARCFIRVAKDEHLYVKDWRWYELGESVWIHEQLRDMARSITCPLRLKELWSRAWLPDDTKHLLTKRKESLPALEVLRFAPEDGAEVQWDFFAGLQKLRLLSLYQCNEERVGGSGDRFPNNLTLLKLEDCASKSVPLSPNWPLRERDLMSLSNLGALFIVRSGPVCLPPSFHKLANLRVLALESNSLAELPEEFGRLPALESLSLHCEDLQELPESFGELRVLRYLIIHDCQSLTKLPTSFGCLPALRYLGIQLCGLTELPIPFGPLPTLRYLSISHCSGLTSLPVSFGHLSALQDLELSLLMELRELPETFGMLSNLHSLALDACDKLERLPDSFGDLSALQELTLELLPGLRELPESFGMLSRLHFLKLSRCANLDKLSDNFGKLEALQKLIINCPLLDGEAIRTRHGLKPANRDNFREHEVKLEEADNQFFQRVKERKGQGLMNNPGVQQFSRRLRYVNPNAAAFVQMMSGGQN